MDQLPNDYVYYPGDSKFNITVTGMLKFPVEKEHKNRRRGFSLGYNLVHYDLITLHDLYVRPIIISREFKNGFMFSVNLQAGMKRTVGKYGDDDYMYFGPSKSIWTIHAHVPVIIGYRF